MKKKSSENDQLTGHFQSFFYLFFFVPPTLNLKKNYRKSTNKKILASVPRWHLLQIFGGVLSKVNSACWVIFHAFIVVCCLTFQENVQSVKRFGTRSGLTFCRSWFGSKLFAKVSRKTLA